MTSRRPRGDAGGLLARPPMLARLAPPPTTLIDVTGQLEELTSLLRRGLLSRAEFERQKHKVLDD